MSSRVEAAALPLAELARLRLLTLAALATVGGADALLVLVGPLAAAGLDAAVVLVLAFGAHLLERREDPREAEQVTGTLAVLMVLPLLGLLSLVMPVRGASELGWYVLVGVPLLLAVALAARTLPAEWTAEALRVRPTRLQAAIALTGVPLGLIGYLIVRPAGLIGSAQPARLVAGSLVLLVFVGFAEELLFRGLLQRVLRELFGAAGMPLAAAAYAVSALGSLSAEYVAFAAASGLFFGWCVARTGALLGVCVAHGLLAIGLVLAWPLLWS
jgi:membrane protease YdiL (CAAX protease family)